MTEQQRRPRQVTVAGWVIVLGSLAAVVTVYDQLTRLHSLVTRESVQKTLDDPVFDELGLGVHTVLDVMHVLALITGACATAAVVLGWHVLRRHRPSRIILTIVAVPLLIAGVGSGGFFSTLVAVAVLLLWIPPGGEWFRDAPSALGSSSIAPPPSPPPLPPPPPAPAASRQQPAGRQLGYPARGGTAPRPAVVTWAALLTWVFSALAAVFVVIGTILVTADPGPALRQALDQDPALAGQGVNEGMLVASAWFLAVLVTAYCIAASVMAGLVWRRVAWARTTLVVLLSVAAVFLLIVSVLAPVIVVALTAAVVGLALLLRRDARAWFEHRGL